MPRREVLSEKQAEEAFTKIADEVISECEGVACSIKDFKQGLDHLIEALQDRRSAEGK